MNIDEVRLRNEFIVPYEEGRPCQQFSVPLHHEFEQMKFARPQGYLPLATLRTPIDKIKFQRPHAQNRLIHGGMRRM